MYFIPGCCFTFKDCITNDTEEIFYQWRKNASESDCRWLAKAGWLLNGSWRSRRAKKSWPVLRFWVRVCDWVVALHVVYTRFSNSIASFVLKRLCRSTKKTYLHMKIICHRFLKYHKSNRNQSKHEVDSNENFEI